MSKRRRRGLRPFVDQLDDRCLLSGSSGLHAGPDHLGLRPECDHVHDRRPAPVKGDGTGETIALIEMYHDPNLPSDLQTFDQAYGLPDPTLTVDQPGRHADR